MEYALKLDMTIAEKFGAGFLEDIIPFMTNIYTTQRWKDAMAEIDAFLVFLKKRVDEHEETFDPSMHTMYLFKVSFFKS